MISRTVTVFVIFALTLSVAFARDARWAKPVAVQGMKNLYQVTEHLYRAAQPSADGFSHMAKDKGLASEIDLTDDSHSDELLLRGTGIRPRYVPMTAVAPNKDKIIAALRFIMAEEKKAPVLVHCTYGADRTGTVIAMYRIVVQGWSKDDAIDEMRLGGFNYHKIPFDLVIPGFIRSADIASYRAALANP
jgi:tyrosine-protein phosphatase SIW14